jgi:hypothetical protein
VEFFLPDNIIFVFQEAGKENNKQERLQGKNTNLCFLPKWKDKYNKYNFV